MLVKAKKKLGDVADIDLVALFQLFGDDFRNGGHLEDAVAKFLVFAAKMLECPFKEHPDVDGLEALFVGVFFQAVCISEVHDAVGNGILLVLDFLSEEIAHCVVILADEPVQF